MKWKYETMAEKVKRLSTWHDWFAWHPVFQCGQAVWLKKIRRRAIIMSLPYESPVIYWEYDI